MHENKTVLITGCSSGFGYFTALKFAREGWSVIAAVRSKGKETEELADIALQENLRLEIVEMDVTKDEAVRHVISTVFQKYKTLDVLVNNAGFGFIGPVEDFEIDEVKEQYDVNIYGVLRVTKAVLPQMRKRKSGKIINVSSVNGLLSFGLYGIYSSSKFALETISEVLRFELKPFNVFVSLVEPGGFDTKFPQKGKKARIYASGNSVYKLLRNPLEKSDHNLRSHPLIRNSINPQRVAEKIYAIACQEKPGLRYKIGIDTHIYTFVKAVVPQSVWDWMLHKVYKW